MDRKHPYKVSISDLINESSNNSSFTVFIPTSVRIKNVVVKRVGRNVTKTAVKKAAKKK